MNVLEAPGVLRATLTTYITVKDAMKLLGCKENKAYQTIKEINRIAEESGMMKYEQGKASKYLFAEKFGIPMEVIEAVIEMNSGSGRDANGLLSSVSKM